VKLTARNQLKGTVVSITRGPIMAIVKIDVGGQQMSATLTAEAVEEFGLAEGAEVYAIFKATAVMIGVD
jgi:molybdate transport system regulatory protein